MTDNGGYVLAPCSVTEARQVVRELHRHLPTPPAGGRFALCVLDPDENVRGVALVGHGARMTANRWTVTVTRVATDGTPNLCSMLYGACARVWRAMGGRVLYTSTLDTESGTSLRAAGWEFIGITDGGEWSREYRPRRPADQPGPKRRYRRVVA